MDPYRIDSHKLIYHPRRVADWLAGEAVYPLYVEVSPTGACNHRCTFCGLDFLAYRPRSLDCSIIEKRLLEMGRLGVKSIMFAGEGEPFLYTAIPEMAKAAFDAGIDLAFSTNGVLLTPAVSEAVLPVSSWIRVSCNAGTPGTYAAIHRTRQEDFTRVWTNLAAAVTIKTRERLSCTIGLQALLLPENSGEMVELARRCRDVGIDYLTVKPFSQHPLSVNRQYQDIRYDDSRDLAPQLSDCETDTFKVFYRRQSMQQWDAKQRPYHRCLALPFWAYIDAGGNVWACSVHLDDERFNLGNIHSESFEAIWNSAKRRRLMDYVANVLDPAQCRVNCRMNAVNTYLHELTHPGTHVNFI